MAEYREQYDPSESPLFQGIEKTERAELLRIAEDVVARPREFVIEEGTPGDGFYVIAAGKFDVMKKGMKDDVLARLEENSFFGEMSLVTDEKRSASVFCVEEGRLKKFPKDRFQRLLAENSIPAHKVILNMCRILAKRLAASDERLAE